MISDSWYIAQNAPRILRAMFEIARKNHSSETMMSILSLCKSVERRLWAFEHPFRQFLSSFDSSLKGLSPYLIALSSFISLKYQAVRMVAFPDSILLAFINWKSSTLKKRTHMCCATCPSKNYAILSISRDWAMLSFTAASSFRFSPQKRLFDR